MKIIILFALASVGVCTESGSSDPPPPKESSTCEPYVRTFDRCNDFVNEYVNDDNCLRHALESVPQLLEIAKKLICKERKNKLDKRFGYYAEFEKELRDFLGCTGCSADKTLGVKEILGHLGAAVGGVVGISVKIIGEIIHSTGHNPALDLMCDLLTGDLTSKCVEMISNSDLTSKTGSLRSISSLRKRRCRLEDSLVTEDTLSDLTSKTGSLGRICSVAEIETLFFEEIDKLLEDLGCIRDNSLGIKDTLSDLTSKTGSLRSISSEAKKDILDLEELIKILEVAGCILDNLLGIKDTLTNVTPDIGEALHSLIKPLLNGLLEKPAIGDLVAGMKCPW